MNEQKLPEAGPKTEERKADWIRPEVEKLIAGGAEGSADIATDGIDIPS